MAIRIFVRRDGVVDKIGDYPFDQKYAYVLPEADYRGEVPVSVGDYYDAENGQFLPQQEEMLPTVPLKVLMDSLTIQEVGKLRNTADNALVGWWTYMEFDPASRQMTRDTAKMVIQRAISVGIIASKRAKEIKQYIITHGG